MTRHIDARKHKEWRGRLERFESRELTVARFCQEEGVTPHRFYYWDKRLRQESNSDGTSVSHSRPSRSKTSTTSANQQTARALPNSRPTTGPHHSIEPMVCFTRNAQLQVSVPANSLDAIRCVLECARHETGGSHSDVPTAQAFRRVIVTDRE